jgi:hypothetical protein
VSIIATTDPDTIRATLARKIETIVPRLEAERDRRWVWQQDQEIPAGTLRNFDVVLEAQREVEGGWYGGGIEYTCVADIRVSYPVSEADLPRFVGADGEDLSSVLVRLHLAIPGMHPIEVVLEHSTEGEGGAYVGIFTTTIPYFASDVVVLEVVA